MSFVCYAIVRNLMFMKGREEMQADLTGNNRSP